MSRTSSYFTHKTGVDADYFLHQVLLFLGIEDPNEGDIGTAESSTIFLYHNTLLRRNKVAGKVTITKKSMLIEKVEK